MAQMAYAVTEVELFPEPFVTVQVVDVEGKLEPIVAPPTPWPPPLMTFLPLGHVAVAELLPEADTVT